MVEDKKTPADMPGVPRCLMCKHFLDCLSTFLRDPRYHFTRNCSYFEEGEWWKGLTFAEKRGEVQISDNLVEEHYDVFDGNGNLIAHIVQHRVVRCREEA